ncbi:hypothetical protein [Elizabethkingia occulta]|uniref:hypothetical protein n=1 Tax=Elizabethkingia occulta TaxID=1867263 RepID=UPI0009995E84|nr:hypothetical protein [Elizabethkingia occulta]OPB87827.1 hypothetical protein BB020_04395 [Elizabethkingia occulta]
MTEFTISQSSSVIDEFVIHLENGHMGAAMLRNWDYKREGNHLYFTLKEGGKIILSDLVWFGYITNN